MYISGLSSYMNTTRYTGLSGLDTESIISQMMQAERVPLNRLYQKRQLVEWRQEEYRSITSSLQSFKNEFFNSLKPSSNMLLQGSYKRFSVVSSDSSVVTVTGNADAIAGSHKIEVKKVATAAASVSGGTVSKGIAGENAVNIETVKGKTFSLQVDGVTKQITVADDITDAAGLVSALQSAIDSAFGEGKVVVGGLEGEGGTQLTFDTVAGSGVNKLMISSGAVEGTDALLHLGFNTYASNRLNTRESLETVASQMKTPMEFSEDGNVRLTINGKEFVFSKETSLATMMNSINSDSSAGVVIQYDEIGDVFRITAKQTGAGTNISIEESGSSFLQAVNLGEEAAYTAGVDAEVVLDGQLLTRSSNTFTVAGLTYTLLKESSDEQTVTLTQDVDAIFDNIINFVDQYNELIKTINDKVSEKYDRNFPPLTEEQKADMSDSEIEIWEKKAKTGLLKNDSLLESITMEMRRALQDAVEGVGLRLSDIGIKTGSWEDKGKLVIDEQGQQKLKEAIRNNPDAVMELFAKEPPVKSNIDITQEEREQRYAGGGLAYRLFDIIENNIRTTRDSDNRKGLLLEKAGIIGDLSELKNSMYEEIEDYNDKIYDMEIRLYNKENAYYIKFSRLETLLSQMTTQSNYFASLLGQQDS